MYAKVVVNYIAKPTDKDKLSYLQKFSHYLNIVIYNRL